MLGDVIAIKRKSNNPAGWEMLGQNCLPKRVGENSVADDTGTRANHGCHAVKVRRIGRGCNVSAMALSIIDRISYHAPQRIIIDDGKLTQSICDDELFTASVVSVIAQRLRWRKVRRFA